MLLQMLTTKFDGAGVNMLFGNYFQHTVDATLPSEGAVQGAICSTRCCS
jgi:hypothetical protein